MSVGVSTAFQKIIFGLTSDGVIILYQHIIDNTCTGIISLSYRTKKEPVFPKLYITAVDSDFKLPPYVAPQEAQVELTMQELRRKSTALDKYVFLQSLQVRIRRDIQ